MDRGARAYDVLGVSVEDAEARLTKGNLRPCRSPKKAGEAIGGRLRPSCG